MHQKLKYGILISIIASCLLLFSSFAYASGFTDIQNHWAETEITKWSDKGLASGYSDGTFQPNGKVTRAEFVALVNRAFEISKEGATEGFADVKPGDWYHNDVATAKTAGYIGGYQDGSFKPQNPVTRQEVASILVRLLDIEPTTAGLEKFSDAARISDWSQGNIGAVVKIGLMRGMPDNSFMPLKSITRAEAIVSLDRALGYLSGGQKDVEPQPPVDSAISGTVTLDGQVVEDATVRVFKAGNYEVLKEIETGNNGKYNLKLDPGYYDMTAATDEEVAYKSNVRVSANMITTADMALEKAAVISGILKDNNDKAVKDTTVLFTTNPTFVTTTNDKGEYTVPVCPNRNYTVRSYEPDSENENPVIVADDFSVGSASKHDVGTQKAPFSIDEQSTPGGGRGTSDGDTTAPVLDSVQYTLNGQSHTISKNSSNNYKINIPNTKDNSLTKLKILVNEESKTSLQVTSDISSISVAKIIDDANLNELEPTNGKITINLDSIAMFLGLVDFSKYSVGTQKYIEFKLTDASGNNSKFTVIVNVVAAE